MCQLTLNKLEALSHCILYFWIHYSSFHLWSLYKWKRINLLAFHHCSGSTNSHIRARWVEMYCMRIRMRAYVRACVFPCLCTRYTVHFIMCQVNGEILWLISLYNLCKLFNLLYYYENVNAHFQCDKKIRERERALNRIE